MPPSKKQPSMAIFSIVYGLIIDGHWFFFNGESFEWAVLNIQIWVGLLHNIMIHKCLISGASCAWPRNSTLKYCTKNKRKDYHRESHTLSASFIFVCLLSLDWQGIARRKSYNHYIKSWIFYRPNKVFSGMHSVIKNSSIEDQQTNLKYMQGNLNEHRVYVNFLCD